MNRGILHNFGWPALVFIVSVLSSTAYAKGADAKGVDAKGADSIEHQVAEARKACLTGDYRKGIAILSDLFIKSKVPNYLYNQGRCFEQNARYEEAILRFEEYLRVTKGSDSKERSEADEHIADCQAKLAKSAMVTPPPTPAPPIVVQQPISAEPKPAATVDQVQPGSSPGRGLRIAGIAVGALGLASLATGVVLNLKANSMADDLNKPTGYDRGKVSQRSGYETGSWIGYGVGSACLIGGSILYYLGYSSKDAGTVALLPLVDTNHAGVAFRGGF